MISVIVLILVFLLIAIRRIGRFHLRIWQIMTAGALAVLASGQIAPLPAFKAINLDVIGFLFGMFVVGQALEESGYLSHLSRRFFGVSKSASALIVFILLGAGFAAALLMNDTVAIIGTPLVLMYAQKNGMRAKPLLLALAFAITTGSVLSPIGNPQNLLIALNGGIDNPFLVFLHYLALPTILNMAVIFLLLRMFYSKDLKNKRFTFDVEPVKDEGLAGLCRASLVLLIVLIAFKIALVFIAPQFDLRLTYIALIAAAPVLLLSRRRMEIIKRLDWSTLVFFAAMFILMASVWDSGVFQSLLERMHLNLSNLGVVLGISVLLSQFISNVPMVALYLPMLNHLGATTGTLMALAAGSTIAGNLTILGAASNVIIIQCCENRSDESISFWEFFRIGLPLTVINVLVYWLFLRLA